MSKLQEAEEFVNKAQKSMKTSLLKWKPDIDSAIEYYGKAAVIYRNLKNLKYAAELYLLIADLHGQNNSHFHSAKAYEASSFIYFEMKDYPKMISSVKTAGSVLRENGVPDTATSIFERAAKSLKDPLPEQAAEFLRCAADTSELEDKYLLAVDFANRAALIWTSRKNFSEAELLLRYQFKLCQLAAADNPQTAYDVCAKAVVALVIIKLFLEDSVAARKVFEEAIQTLHFDDTSDALPVNHLLQAYEDFDDEAANRIIKQPTFRTLENEYSCLARSIQFPTMDTVHVEKNRTIPIEAADESDNEDIC